MKLSACWIVKNEEANIARSMESVRSAVDEMIVVDTGSSDATPDIARELGARVEAFTWTGDFAAARNYALDLTSGDVILFLDADEWFEPALDAEMRRGIEKAFARMPHIVALNVQFSNIDLATGILLEQYDQLRIFKKLPELRYEGSIHERLALPNGALVPLTNLPYNVNHSGYSYDRTAGKIQRNIEMMEKALQQPGLDGGELIRLHLYLMREYFHSGRLEAAFQSLTILVDLPNFFTTVAKFTILNSSFFFMSLELCNALRGKVSRKGLPLRLVNRMHKVMADSPLTPLADYYYLYLFGGWEEDFLREVQKNLAPGGPATNSTNDQYNRILSHVYQWAAVAAWRRGEVAGAFDFASFSFLQGTDVFNSDALDVLLAAMRGQPKADQILLLERLVGAGNERKMSWLMNRLRAGDDMELYLYFFKKQVENGWTTGADLFYVQLLSGKYDELFMSLAKAKEEGKENFASGALVGDMALMLALCAPEKAGEVKKEGLLFGREGLLAACEAGKALAKPPAEQTAALYSCYPLLYKVNREMAERLWAMFAAAPEEQYLCKASFLLQMGRYGEAAQVDWTAVTAHPDCANTAVYALLMAGRYDEALGLAKEKIDGEGADMALLNSVGIIARRAEGAVASEAAALYVAQKKLMDEYIDMQDIVNTGFAEETSKKQAKALANMAARQLAQTIEEDPCPVTDSRYLAALKGAAKVYEEKKDFAGAAHCWLRAATAGENSEVKAGLARCFAALGNSAAVK